MLLLLVAISEQMNTSSINWVFTYKCVLKPTHCCKCHNFLKHIQPYSHFDCDVDKRYYWTRSFPSGWKKAIGVSNRVNQQYEKITYSSIAYWMQSSILFFCTETNNIFRAVLSSEDAVFSMRIFTWSWCLPDSGICRSAHRLNVKPSSLQD